MKKISYGSILLQIIAFGLISSFTSCIKDNNPIKFPNGTVPDTATFALTEINSEYDDYNLDLNKMYTGLGLVFSSNRNSSGSQFDLVQSGVSFTWDQTDGTFEYDAEMISDPFLTSLLGSANTAGDDFGPYRFFSIVDGFEYTILASANGEQGLDLYYLKNLPQYSNQIPSILGPYPVTRINTASDEAYFSFNLGLDSAYFSSNRSGTSDIYLIGRPSDLELAEWLSGTSSPGILIDSVNSSFEDKFPFIFKDIMVFASNRPGGRGGFDLYVSIFRNGKWSTPENLGPDINTESDECRPVVVLLPGYTNYLLLFSSNRPGGKGLFDLYFRGVSIDTD
jgi:hypothetical protein